jgi:hypothetical protein
MAIMKGLASYELFKMGFMLYMFFCFLGCSIYFLIKSISKNYQKIGGNITNNSDNTQTLTYTVNNKNYVKIIPFTMGTTDKNGVYTPPRPAYSPGNCTVYYAEKDPDDYQVNINPVFISKIITGILCVLSCLMLGSFIFFSKNREAAGVVGGIDAASTVVSMFNR